MLNVKELRVSDGGAAICRIPELVVGRGERKAIYGPNGSGKTTLLRVLSGLHREFQGVCEVDAALPARVYVHQTPYLFQGSVEGNVGYGLAARRVPRRERPAAIRHWLTVFGVEHLAKRRADKLSGGERRRVALARAFAVAPDLLLLDEPFADLDQQGADLVCAAIEAAKDATILIAAPAPLPKTLDIDFFQLPRANT